MKYEYKLIIKSNQTVIGEELLNQLGTERWELISIVHHANAAQFMYHFKREVL
jgi:hypothetical protein